MVRSQARRPTSWLLLIAVLFATLAPSFGMALGGQSAARTIWTQLCSVNGPKQVAIQVNGDTDPTTSYDQSIHQGHCVLCAQPATAPRLPELSIGASTTV